MCTEMATKNDADASPTTTLMSQELPVFHEEWKTLQEQFPHSSLHNQTTELKECTVTIQLSIKEMDFVLTFSLAENYPHEMPNISLCSRALSKTEINEVLRSLDTLCFHSIGQPMLMLCIEEAVNLLQTLKSSSRRHDRKKRRKKKKARKTADTSDEEDETCFEETSSGGYSDSTHNACSTLKDVSLETVKNNDSVSEAKALRPNYFVAIRIWDESLIHNLVFVQNALVEQEVLLTKGTVPISALHITLCNLGLDKADDLLRAMEALRKMKSKLQDVLPASPVVVHGASQFYDRAIYAKVKPNEDFLAFRGVLIEELKACGVEFREDHENYTPHVTLIKVRRPERRMFGNRPIPPRIYSSFLETVHGEQIVDAVYLCAMDGNKREDGFYVTPYEVQFNRRH